MDRYSIIVISYISPPGLKVLKWLEWFPVELGYAFTYESIRLTGTSVSLNKGETVMFYYRPVYATFEFVPIDESATVISSEEKQNARGVTFQYAWIIFDKNGNVIEDTRDGSKTRASFTLTDSSTITPAPTPTLTPTPTQERPPWPKTSYNGVSTTVYPLDSNSRYQSFCGPSKSYHGAGAYKSYKIESIQALFIENGYVYVDLSYTTVGTRRLYFQKKIFTSLSGVPEKISDVRV